MGTFGVALAVSAAVIPSAALTVHAVVRLPRLSPVDVSLVAIFVAVAAVMVAEATGGALPEWAVSVSMLAWLAFLLIFPSGAPTNTVLAIVAAAGALLLLLGLGLPALAPVEPVAFGATFAALAAGQVWRYHRRSSIAERQSTKWLMLGLIPATGAFFGIGLISLLPAAGPGIVEQPWYLAASTIGMWLIPLAATAGILVGERGPVDELVRFTIAATGTVFVATAVYLAVLGVAPPGWAAAAACLSVLPSAWAFLSLGTTLAYARGPQRPLASLPAKLGSASTPGEVGAAVAASIRDALGVPAVEVTARDESLARAGDPEEPTTTHRVVAFHGVPVAEVRVAPRRGETGLTRRDREILDRVALIAGPALRAADAARQADEANERLTTTRADERRRLHADLHDELGPALAGLGFTARAAARALEAGDARVAAMLESIESGTHALVRRVREISYDLRSAELSGEHLERILEGRLRVPDDPLQIRLDCEPVPDELAQDVLRIVQEAVANVRRHAAARVCEVSVRGDDEDQVWITVTDDGDGALPDAPSGIGQASIRARATAHGGSVEFTSTERGSRLTAMLATARSE